MYQESEKRKVSGKEGKVSEVKYLTTAGIMAALITLTTAYVCHIPIGVNGGYIHFGDSLIYLTAALLPTPYALAAAAIGGGLADLLTAPMWAPATIIIKMLLVVSFTSKTNKIVNLHNIVAMGIACVITIGGYYFAEYLIFGVWPIPISMLQNFIQCVGSAVFFLIFGIALDRANIKVKLFD